MEYTIPAIPTCYQGTQMESRLEAQWAAMFNRMDWRWLYEPVYFSKRNTVERYVDGVTIDQRYWLPDFALGNRDGKAVLLVEVKPFCTGEEFVKVGVTEKVRNAIGKCNPSKLYYRRVLYLGKNNHFCFGNANGDKDWREMVGDIRGRLWGEDSFWEQAKAEIAEEVGRGT